MTIYMWTDCVPKFVTLPSPSLTQHVVKMHIFRAFFVLMSRNCDIFRYTSLCHCDTLLEKDKHKQEKIVRLSTVIITANTEIHSGVHLLEVHAPQLAQAAQPGQFCMVRCCDTLATDPLLRRPFFIHSVQRRQGLCTLLVHVRGRGTAWLVKQQEGALLDILGPLGHGWIVRPVVRNLLLIGEEEYIAALTFLAQSAIEQELAVTIIQHSKNAVGIYPPALLPAEAEYQIITSDGSVGLQGDLTGILGNYLEWADAACCSVSHETALALYSAHERLRLRHFAQAAVLRPLVCGNGACLTCQLDTHAGSKLVCRDGPVFELRDIM